MIGKDNVSVSGSNKLKVRFLETQNEYVISNGTVEEYQKPEATSVYAKLFDTNADGNGDLLVLSSTNDYADEEYGTLITNYDNQDNTENQPAGGDEYWSPIWYDDNTNIKTVVIKDKIVPKSCSYWFADCELLNKIENIENLDTSNVESMSDMFNGCKELTSLNLANVDTSNVTNMVRVFSKCSKLVLQELINLDTSNVTDMTSMFYGCDALTKLDLSTFNTSNVTNMGMMFCGCDALTELDLSTFNTSNVTNMGMMFCECTSLKELDLSTFNTSNVTNMISMFYGCTSLEELDVSNFDVSKLTTANPISTMGGMFDGLTCKIKINSQWTEEMKKESGYQER